ncbi:MAG: hypothetical protein NZM00_11730, partial [Anaerolinea sp.]|nr:hypothetical protein [Anaerolinea sp.]
ALGFTLDYAASAAGLSAAIRRDLLGDRWTLLRVTPLREGGLILAKYAAAQCRGWWPVMVMIGLRAGLAAVWFVMLLIAGSLSPIAILTPILVIGFLIVEPVARLRSFSALGTYVSAQVTGGLGGHLLMAAYLGAFWFAQSIVLLSLILITAPFIFFLALSADPTLSLLWLVYIPLIAVMSTALALTIRAWALRATVRSVKSYHERS